MKRKYRDWIKKYVRGNVAGLCGEYTILMRATYPELKMINGEFMEPDERYSSGHCWLLDPEGKVVDPTISQFKKGGWYEDGDPWFPQTNRELFDLAVRSAEIICGEKLLPDNTWVAWQVRELLEHYEDEIKYRQKEKPLRPKKKRAA